jgi:hypothetical protein
VSADRRRGVRHDPRIDEIETCSDFGNVTYMVHLKDGFRLDDAHAFGEDTMASIRETMRSVQPCDCEFCRVALIKAEG